jgi:hypothetical protein
LPVEYSTAPKTQFSPRETSPEGSFTDPVATGRGTLTIITAQGTRSFAYYPLTAGKAKIIAIDGQSTESGDFGTQSTAPFSTASLNGGYVFSITGTKTSVPFGMVGVLTFSGTGSISNIQFDGLTQSVFDFNPGAYSVVDPSTGRSTATWTANSGFALRYVLYPRIDGTLVLLETDGTYAASGIAKPQNIGNTPNFLTLGGAFALQLAGANSSASTPTALTGQAAVLASSGTYSLTGTVDELGKAQASSAVLYFASFATATQRYVFGISGTPDSLYLYRIDDNGGFAITSGGSTVPTGQLQRQY